MSYVFQIILTFNNLVNVYVVFLHLKAFTTGKLYMLILNDKK